MLEKQHIAAAVQFVSSTQIQNVTLSMCRGRGVKNLGNDSVSMQAASLMGKREMGGTHLTAMGKDDHSAAVQGAVVLPCQLLQL